MSEKKADSMKMETALKRIASWFESKAMG
jgi:hypothetical protein